MELLVITQQEYLQHSFAPWDLNYSSLDSFQDVAFHIMFFVLTMPLQIGIHNPQV